MSETYWRGLTMTKTELEEYARTFKYAQKTFVTKSSLIKILPIEKGWVSEFPWDGEPYDSSKYTLQPDGWDHEHCFVCGLRVENGDSWWAASPPDQLGLCEECHLKLFGYRVD